MADMKRLAERAIIAVTGEDAASFLGGLATNGPPQDGACFSALLTPQGKVLFDFFIFKAPDGYLLDVHQDASEALLKRLTLYRLRAKVQLDVADDRVVVVDAASEVPARNISTGRAILSADDAAILDVDAGYHARRIAAGVPEWGADFEADDVFPMDVNYDLLNGVDYRKGCFVGQEVASRMKRKGAARKRTLIAAFDGPPPSKEASVTAGDSTLGHIMSGVDGCALALIRLDRLKTAEAGSAPILADGKELRLALPPYMQQD